MYRSYTKYLVTLLQQLTHFSCNFIIFFSFIKSVSTTEYTAVPTYSLDQEYCAQATYYFFKCSHYCTQMTSSFLTIVDSCLFSDRIFLLIFNRIIYEDVICLLSFARLQLWLKLYYALSFPWILSRRIKQSKAKQSMQTKPLVRVR